MKGYGWATGSLLLVSVAQLLMKWSMSQLPAKLFSMSPVVITASPVSALIALIAGVACYGLSMMCWFFALQRLPLNRAYSLLALSYALVYLAAACVPVFNEPLHGVKSLGIVIIVLGIVLINRPSSDDAVK